MFNLNISFSNSFTNQKILNFKILLKRVSIYNLKAIEKIFIILNNAK